MPSGAAVSAQGGDERGMMEALLGGPIVTSFYVPGDFMMSAAYLPSHSPITSGRLHHHHLHHHLLHPLRLHHHHLLRQQLHGLSVPSPPPSPCRYAGGVYAAEDRAEGTMDAPGLRAEARPPAISRTLPTPRAHLLELPALPGRP